MCIEVRRDRYSSKGMIRTSTQVRRCIWVKRLQCNLSKDGQTMQSMAKRKETEGQITIYKTLHRKQKIEQHEFRSKTWDELSCTGRVSSSCSINLAVNSLSNKHWFLKQSNYFLWSHNNKSFHSRTQIQVMKLQIVHCLI
jgi:hypothetical protein